VVIIGIPFAPGESGEGARLANELLATHPEAGVVVLSEHAEPEYASLLFGQGSARRAYLLTESVAVPSRLRHAVQTVADGGSVVDPAAMSELVDERRRREESKLAALTPRELEILRLIAEGRSNAAIAESLVITKRAVERHINSIFLKLDLRESAEVSRRVVAALRYLAAQA
jgi:DNA-binding NarL/FixJ family response regulator